MSDYPFSWDPSVFQHSDDCAHYQYALYLGPPMAPATAITSLVDTTLGFLKDASDRSCSLCSCLYRCGRHFVDLFHPAAEDARVGVQYTTEFTQVRLILRSVKPGMSQIEVKISAKTVPRRSLSFITRPDASAVETSRHARSVDPARAYTSGSQMLAGTSSWGSRPLFRQRASQGQLVIESENAIAADTLHHTLKLARKWLDECIQKPDDSYLGAKPHSMCPPNHASPLPTRVLCIENNAIRLVVTNGGRGRYVCLSHCWGSYHKITTTRANIGSHMKEILWDGLPRTFQDAVAIADGLDCPYLWIDSLCIIQDDLRDWEIESAKMASVYKHSYLTIAATRASDGRDGCLLPPSERRYMWSPQISQASRAQARSCRTEAICNLQLWQPFESSGWTALLEPRHDILNHACRRPVEEYLDLGFPLLTRAWFLQERLLSARVLHFGPSEIYWECFTGLRCECLEAEDTDDRSAFLRSTSQRTAKESFSKLFTGSTSGRPAPYTSSFSSREEAWAKLVEEYSRLYLTEEQDRLPALSGISEDRDKYAAGILLEYFPRCLYWIAGPGSGRRNQRPRAYRAPTFSWASIDGPVNYVSPPRYSLLPGSTKVVSELIESACTVEGSDPRGRVTGGHLRIRGWSGRALVKSTSRERKGTVCQIQNDGLSQAFILDVEGAADQEWASAGAEVTCLLLECGKASLGWDNHISGQYRAVALVLRSSPRVQGAFERIGLIYPGWKTDYTGGFMADGTVVATEVGVYVDGMFGAAPKWFTNIQTLTVV
ncbi:HET-domain-containing protein [Colletotrichum zoysiae]|uniref:HET-domain-containing protein n=1 Tax=Colletotrichum zoysiae TaxID=1216348 RepID=A0AAD9HMK5_9PEZI|nr:HET-domain-containing protein [Colletotrichum zoysiae]